MNIPIFSDETKLPSKADYEVLPLTKRQADGLVYVSCTDSTQNIARNMIKKGDICASKDGKLPVYAIVADDQTAGRGRLGRKWVSRPGESFLVSFVVLLPKNIVMDASRNGWLPIIAGLCARDSLLETFSEYKSKAIHGDECTLKLKWPNDIFLHDCKEGGILTELVSSTDNNYIGVVFGIGLNLHVPQFVLPIKMATSLQMHMTSLPESLKLRDFIASHIVSALRLRLSDFIEKYPNNYDDLLSEFTKVCWTLDRFVSVHPVNGNAIKGLAFRIGEDASIAIREDSGNEVVVKSGDVHAVAYESEDLF